MVRVRSHATFVEGCAGIFAIVLFLGGCGGGSNSGSAHAKCAAELTTWRVGAGGADLGAIGKAVVRYGHAAAALASSAPTAASISQLSSAAASLRAAIQKAQADHPPACVPGLQDSYSAALGDFARAAQDAQESGAAIQNGHAQTAVSDIRASTIALVAGAHAIEMLRQDIANFRSSG
jgi:hypothetical protein